MTFNWSLVVPRAGESFFTHDDHEDGPHDCSWVGRYVFCSCGAQFPQDRPVSELPADFVVTEGDEEITHHIRAAA